MNEVRFGGRCGVHLSPKPCPKCAATHKINTDRTAAVSLEAFWIPVGPDTPRGVSMLLISEEAGVLQKGQYDPNNKFFTHWFPNPQFKKD